LTVQVKLILSADAPLPQLFQIAAADGAVADEAFSFARTLSRLREMQSVAYFNNLLE
jgi:predicted ATPase